LGLQEYLKQKLSAFGAEDKLFIGALILIAIFLFSLVSGFSHIPSPIYGGDFYMARGFAQAILQGTPFWEDPYFSGNYAYYGWLSFLTTAFFARATGVGLERMTLILAAVIEIFYLLACYLFGTAFFKSKRYGLLFAFAAFSVKFIDMKLSGSMAIMFMLLSLYSFVRYEQGSRRHKYALGIFMGLTALSHINIFIGLILLLIFTIFVESIIKLSSGSPDKPKVILGIAKKYILPFAIAILLSLALVGPWIFVYHMKTLNPTQQYSLQDISKVGIGWVLQTAFSLFVRLGGSGLSTVLNFAWGIILILGLVFAILNKKSQEPRFALLWLIGAILATSHFLLTRPLLGNWIVPGHLWGATAWIADLVLLVYGFRNLELMLSKLGIRKEIVLAAFLIFLSVLFIQNYTNYNNDRWVQYGKTMDPGTQVLFEVEGWILNNTPKNSVFLANDESSFALNALTGRRLVIARRTHASYYVDVEKRYADAIVMLYGSNRTKTIELLKSYNVTYLYLDGFLLQYPLITSLKYKDYLKNNGVNYSIENVRLDPSTTEAPSYLSLVVPPQEPRIMTYNLTLAIHQFLLSGQPYSVIFGINLPG
jgi:hypothetical protein